MVGMPGGLLSFGFGLLCSAHPFCVTLRRRFTPGLVASERVMSMCPLRQETIPILCPACHPAFTLYRVGWFVHDDASTRLQLPYPYPVHRGGRSYCDTASFTVSLTCMDLQLRKSSDFRRPAPALTGSFGRTGHTQSVHADPSINSVIVLPAVALLAGGSTLGKRQGRQLPPEVGKAWVVPTKRGNDVFRRARYAPVRRH